MKSKTKTKEVVFGSDDEKELQKRRSQFESQLDMNAAHAFLEQHDTAEPEPIYACTQCGARSDSEERRFCEGWDRHLDDWRASWKAENIVRIQ